MKIKFGKIAATIGLTLTALTASAVSPASAARNVGQNEQALNMRIYQETRAPIGHVLFCQSNPDQCHDRNVSQPSVPQLTNERWNELVEINDYVNQTVSPVTDLDLYRTIEHWTYPQGGAGDCEDYVLEKQRHLVALGWPSESLLITVVRDENGDGHAILTVTTSAGDFLLDNRYPIIRRWQDAPYTFRKRQSHQNPSEWVSLAPNGNIFSQLLQPSSGADPVSSR